MILDRAIAPQSQEIQSIDLIRPVHKLLDNGISVYEFNAGEQELIRIEWVFNQMNWSDDKPLTSYIAHHLLNAGTTKYSFKQIIEKVDYYGAFLQTDYGTDKVTLTLFTLNKYLKEVLPIVKECLVDSIFPVQEIDIFTDTQKQQLSVALQKNDFVARRKFNQLLFGNTIYGYEVQDSDYQNVNRDSLLSYFKSVYQPTNCEIFMAGKINQDIFDTLNTYFGSWQEGETLGQINQFCFEAIQAKEVFVEKPKALQSALRLGQISVNRSHADFAVLQFVNCLLGGYFGSRLMANIREDKGYTYGIGSALVSLQHAGYLFIATEVGVEVCKSTLDEIALEMHKLQNDLASESEVSLVRNYLMGSFLGGLENAFSHADKFKNIHFYGLDYQYYEQYLHTVRHIEPEQVRTLAQQYLSFDRLNRVIVGKK